MYRPVAANGALLYFLINNLHELDRCYHFSMANFVAILGKGASLLVCLQSRQEAVKSLPSYHVDVVLRPASHWPSGIQYESAGSCW